MDYNNPLHPGSFISILTQQIFDEHLLRARQSTPGSYFSHSELFGMSPELFAPSSSILQLGKLRPVEESGLAF